MAYRQITLEERYTMAALRRQGWCPARIARELGRHRSTVYREFRRNSSRWDGSYRPSQAQEHTNGRRSRSRRNRRFGIRSWSRVVALLEKDWSPEQISGHMDRTGSLSISHETIYRYVWEDRARGGTLYRHLRQATKKRRKRYRSYDSRGRLAGKRHISERPKDVDQRRAVGHWEIDTVMGAGNNHCVVTLVDRASGYTLIGKLRARNMAEAARRTTALVRRHPGRFRTITVSGQTAPSGRYPAQVGSDRVVGEEFLPSPRRELLDPTCRMVSHALQHVDQIRVGIHSLQPAGGQ